MMTLLVDFNMVGEDGRLPAIITSKQLESLALSVEERSFVMEALLNPVGLEAIAKQVDSPELARQVYTVSCLAIRIDTDQEHAYLQELAQRLSISKSDRENIRRELGQT